MAVEDALMTVDAWLRTVFAANAPLMALVGDAVHADVDVDQGGGYPFLLIEYQGTKPDVSVFPVTPILANPLYMVRVVDRDTSYVNCWQAYRLAHPLIHGQHDQPVASTGGRIVTCVRKQGFRQPETVQGFNYRSLGGLYEFQVA